MANASGPGNGRDDGIAASVYWRDRLGPYTTAELNEMRRTGVCPCGIEDAVRHPMPQWRQHTVPTSKNCPWHMEEALRNVG